MVKRRTLFNGNITNYFNNFILSLILIIYLIYKFMQVKRVITEIVIEVEKDYPQLKGTDKLLMAIKLIKQKGGFFKLISDKFLISLINKIVENFNKFIK